MVILPHTGSGLVFCKIWLLTLVIFSTAQAAHRQKRNELDEEYKLNSNKELPCGVESNRQNVAGGKDGNIAQVPWQVSLRDSEGIHYCGAVLLNREFVLTAKHCKNKFSTTTLIAIGWTDSNGYEVDDMGQHGADMGQAIKRPSEWISHGTLDLALIKLASPVIYKEDTQYLARPACLPTDNNNTPKECIISGWGIPEFSSGETNFKLQIAELIKTITPTKCKTAYRSFGTDPIGKRIQSNKNAYICTDINEEERVDTTRGDSGGPFSCLQPGTNRFIVRGIVTGGDASDRKDQKPLPGVYTMLSKEVVTWIQETITSHESELRIGIQMYRETSKAEQFQNISNAPGNGPMDQPDTLWQKCKKFIARLVRAVIGK
jgi:secreted trypsin-like serine protease